MIPQVPEWVLEALPDGCDFIWSDGERWIAMACAEEDVEVVGPMTLFVIEGGHGAAECPSE